MRRSTVKRHDVRPGCLEIEPRTGGLNRGDLYARDGLYRVGRSVDAAQPVKPRVAGGEVAGVVTAVGDDVEGWEDGDRAMVFAYNAFRQQLVVPAGRALAIPDRLDWAQAAAVPINFVTVHDALVTAGRLQTGEVVMVNGASSGIGVATLMLAPHLGALGVIAVSRSQPKLERLFDLGLQPLATVVSGEEDVVSAVREVVPAGVDVIVDVVGAGATRSNVDVAALAARIVSVGRVGGPVDEINLDELARKRLSLVGTTFRTRDESEAAAVIQAAGREVLAPLEDGTITPIVDRVFGADDLASAMDYMAADGHIGKIVLEFKWSRV